MYLKLGKVLSSTRECQKSSADKIDFTTFQVSGNFGDSITVFSD